MQTESSSVSFLSVGIIFQASGQGVAFLLVFCSHLLWQLGEQQLCIFPWLYGFVIYLVFRIQRPTGMFWETQQQSLHSLQCMTSHARHYIKKSEHLLLQQHQRADSIITGAR